MVGQTGLQRQQIDKGDVQTFCPIALYFAALLISLLARRLQSIQMALKTAYIPDSIR